MNDVEAPPPSVRSPAGLAPPAASFWRDLQRVGLRAVVLARPGGLEVVLPPRGGGGRAELVAALAARRGVALARVSVGRDPGAVLREQIDLAWLACALPAGAAAAVAGAFLGGARVALRSARPGNLPRSVLCAWVQGAGPAAARALARAGFLREPGGRAWWLEVPAATAGVCG